MLQPINRATHAPLPQGIHPNGPPNFAHHGRQTDTYFKEPLTFTAKKTLHPLGKGPYSIDPNDEVIKWYNTHAAQYIKDTLTVDMEGHYAFLLGKIPEKSKIMDAGCGAGRDLKIFADKGYDAEGLDASEALAKHARDYSGRPVYIMKFQDMDTQFPKDKFYDGIWACASLLHVPKKEFSHALDNLANILKPGGYLVASLKEGNSEEHDQNGRFFNYISLDEIKNTISENPKLKLETLILQDNTFRPGDHAFITLVAKRVDPISATPNNAEKTAGKPKSWLELLKTWLRLR